MTSNKFLELTLEEELAEWYRSFEDPVIKCRCGKVADGHTNGQYICDACDA